MSAPRLDPVVRFLACGLFVIALGFGIIAPALPLLAGSFGVGTSAVTLVISVFAGARLAGGLLAGRVIRRFGARRVLGWGVLLVGGCTGLCALAGGYGQLVVFRGLAGIGSTLLTVAIAVLVAEFAPPDQRGRAAGLITTAGMLGRIGGPVVGGLLAQGGLRLPFLGYALLLGTVGLVAPGVLRKSVARSPVAAGTGGPAMPEAVRHPTYRAALAGNFAVDGWTATGLQAGILPLYVVELMPGRPALAGVTLSAFAAGTLILLAPAGRLADTRGRKPVALCGIGGTALATVAMGFAGSAPTIVLTSFAAGAGAGLLSPPMSAAVTDLASVPGERGGRGGQGAVLAGFQMAGDAGAILGPLVLGVLATLLSYRDTFFATAAVVAVAGLAWLGARETTPAR